MVRALIFPEDARAVERALRALEGEQKQLELWGGHSVDLGLCIDDLRLLLGRLRDAEQEQEQPSVWSRQS